MANRLFSLCARDVIAPAYAGRLLFRSPIQSDNFGMGQNFDILGRFNAANEILRHALGENSGHALATKFLSAGKQPLTRRVASRNQPTVPRPGRYHHC